MAVHIEHVQRRYADHELLQFGSAQARAVAEMLDLEQQKKEAAEHFKSSITKYETEIKALSQNINRGYEIIPTPCDVMMNTPTRGMKSLIDQKTLTTVRVIPMDESDKQSGLFDGTD